MLAHGAPSLLPFTSTAAGPTVRAVSELCPRSVRRDGGSSVPLWTPRCSPRRSGSSWNLCIAFFSKCCCWDRARLPLEHIQRLCQGNLNFQRDPTPEHGAAPSPQEPSGSAPRSVRDVPSRLEGTGAAPEPRGRFSPAPAQQGWISLEYPHQIPGSEIPDPYRDPSPTPSHPGGIQPPGKAVPTPNPGLPPSPSSLDSTTGISPGSQPPSPPSAAGWGSQAGNPRSQ